MSDQEKNEAGFADQLLSTPSSPVDLREALCEQEREWTVWAEQRPPNAPGTYRFRASFMFLGLKVRATWTEKLTLCGMGCADSEWWPLTPCTWDGYRRYMTIAPLEWSPVQAYDPDGVEFEGLDLLPCPFSGKAPKLEPSGQYIGAPLWRSEAVWISSPGVPRRRWTDAKAMQASWNTRTPTTPAPPIKGDEREAIVHSIKCWPGPFSEMVAGRKTAEFRANDRDYRAGDTLQIREWDPETDTFTGRKIAREISHVLDSGFGLPAGYAMLSLRHRTDTADAGEVRMASLVDGLSAALSQFSEPMSALSAYELGQRLADDVSELIRPHRAALTPSPEARENQESSNV